MKRIYRPSAQRNELICGLVVASNNANSSTTARLQGDDICGALGIAGKPQSPVFPKNTRADTPPVARGFIGGDETKVPARLEDVADVMLAETASNNPLLRMASANKDNPELRRCGGKARGAHRRND
jgi:hypothetical protein